MDIESDNYDPSADIFELFSTEDSLNQLQQLLDYTNEYKQSIDQQIQETEEEHQQYLTQEAANLFDFDNAQSQLTKIIQEVNQNKQLSTNTQTVITEMTSGIKELDDSKKNLVLTMTVLKRLQMLIIAYEQLDSLIQEQNYSNSVHLLSAVDELIEHFKTYKSIPEISELTKKINQLKGTLVDQIFADFEQTIQNRDDSKLDERELKSCCDILDVLGLQYHDRLVNWFCNQQLKEIKSIFSSTDEAGSLDNLSRRFVFFKKVLKNYEEYYVSIFPEKWNIGEELSMNFCVHTRDSIKQVLADSKTKVDVDLLMNSLQQTIDFEKYLNNKFHYKNNKSLSKSEAASEQDQEIYDSSKSKFSKIISAAYEPFLNIWVDHQNSFLSSKFLEFMAQPKLPPQNSASATEANSTTSQINVIQSSADLFRAYRHLLTQCSTLSMGQPLFDLSKLFSKWGIEYSNKILKPTLPPPGTLINDEGIVYVTLVLNTADYCSTTVQQLEDKIRELIDEPFKDRIDFEPIKDSFLRLINQSINLLIHKISTEVSFSWREFNNTDWENLQQVNDQSRYVISLRNILNENFNVILPKFARDVYTRNLCDKVVDLVITQFLANIVKIKPIKIVVAEQLLLDLAVLKETFLRLPILTNQGTISSQYSRHVDRTVAKVEVVLKLLLTPDVPQDGLIDSYFYLIGDKSVVNFKKLLVLKGFSTDQMTKYLDNFKVQVKNYHIHRNESELIESSPIMERLDLGGNSANMNLNPPQATLQTNSHGSNSPQPGAGSPNLNNIISGPKLNIEGFLKNNQFEKNLKEFANDQNQKLNELNLKAGIGKFFNRGT
ncbi:hypothetical protein WICPIJ_001740 [Wickerhamomyces pijperi]|uniref:Vps53 N-terminal domain-containing protein n=1 Tax=Wickerhamomyces pijperi TaxID=599730 RepID=A0A9P8QAD4_WICPI|nr:hypothetical protein WICPIJ_001740 [Wickerhamomyces pijperi]